MMRMPVCGSQVKPALLSKRSRTNLSGIQNRLFRQHHQLSASINYHVFLLLLPQSPSPVWSLLVLLHSQISVLPIWFKLGCKEMACGPVVGRSGVETLITSLGFSQDSITLSSLDRRPVFPKRRVNYASSCRQSFEHGFLTSTARRTHGAAAGVTVCCLQPRTHADAQQMTAEQQQSRCFHM